MPTRHATLDGRPSGILFRLGKTFVVELLNYMFGSDYLSVYVFNFHRLCVSAGRASH
jgi:hypothetical protein